jgi:hypothetical protein
VDLLRVEHGLARATWILPEPTEPPQSPFAPRRGPALAASAESDR